MAIRQENTAAPGAVREVVAALIAKARAAQKIFERSTQAQLDEAATAAGWAIMEPSRNKALAELAVKDTGLGVVADKILKNHRKTLGLLRDLQGAKLLGERRLRADAVLLDLLQGAVHTRQRFLQRCDQFFDRLVAAVEIGPRRLLELRERRPRQLEKRLIVLSQRVRRERRERFSELGLRIAQDRELFASRPPLALQLRFETRRELPGIVQLVLQAIVHLIACRELVRSQLRAHQRDVPLGPRVQNEPERSSRQSGEDDQHGGGIHWHEV